ncbi:hypothetical protein IHV12_19605 [Fictibacillus sp. 7GRE50]|uniref:hypothetical protein n=1 Tax=Fictibacillus sp. 7GRE50 TaxID=2745878 RepID=UPI0018CCC31F|nr:hypothetical protein [Fictibacillus sp. 7GRE50]MBH0167134.1 hypothetical protein [Fictibacillus sp. 7GRE50]
MIYVRFKVDKRWKNVLSPNKKYTLKNASISLSNAEDYATEQNVSGQIEFIIYEDESLLFRDICSVGKGEASNLILLVSRTLNTTFQDTPKEEKKALLYKLSIAMNDDEAEVKQTSGINRIQSLLKDKKAKLTSHLKQREEAKREQQQADLLRQEEEKEVQRQLALKRQAEEREALRQAEIMRQEAERKAQRQAELKRQELEELTKEAEKDAERQEELKRQEAERDAERQAELKRQEAERDAERQAELKRQEAERDAERQAELKQQEAEREAEKQDEVNRKNYGSQNQQAEREAQAELKQQEAEREAEKQDEVNRKNYGSQNQQETTENKAPVFPEAQLPMSLQQEIDKGKLEFLEDLKREKHLLEKQMKKEFKRKEKEHAAFERKQKRFQKEIRNAQSSLYRSRPLAGLKKIMIVAALVGIGIYGFSATSENQEISSWKDGIEAKLKDAKEVILNESEIEKE